MDKVDCIVIGAGVIGLAVARRLALHGLSVIILESQSGFGTGISSRNSEVIHSGIYYRPKSLKARLCAEGKRLLYQYAAEHKIANKQCGKLVVANNPRQIGKLHQIKDYAQANGVINLALLNYSKAAALEPTLRCSEALLVPDTGIIDTHAYMLQLLADAESAGASICYRSTVTKILCHPKYFTVHLTCADGSEVDLSTTQVVNATGLSAHQLAHAIDKFPKQFIPSITFAKGNYFSLRGPSPFSRLVYPVPEPGGLGVHLTLDLNGQARFGPDVEWLSCRDAAQIDYKVDPSHAERFYQSIRVYWPEVARDALQPAYAGIRPKLTRDGTEQDFQIQGHKAHGIRGLINLFGIESPGITASLAIAEHVNTLLAKF